MSEALKPCPVPWCGHAAKMSRTSRTSTTKDDRMRFAYCPLCDLRGPFKTTEAEAIAAWNTRPGDAVLKLAQEVADFGHSRRVEFLSTDLPEIQRMVFKFAELLPDREKPNAAV